ncbi:excinuclease ABC subunit UvrA [Enterococcus raffinosus]|uniref:ATP-binding cassette domain-containing protein n=1 Tax=Enterococcus raffinosus TaxID=71452 RepID=UPI001C0FCE3B|nr:excinuclease ABC subunit UvrA [Enterococcus raffinosus]MBU5363568.1 excinuclease ABC subunit UvrA [Enterococcus raffinosus]
MTKTITILGARSNNLKNISVAIPKGKITVVTGLSGSGKSSLVFDTLAAESQRLLNETYSSYLQQMLPHYERPIVDKIENPPVSIVIDQKRIGGNIRSTVGTATDIYTSLRLLYSRIAQPFIGYSMIYSFNHPAGMCQSCQGTGKCLSFDLNKLIDFDRSLAEGAICFPTFQPGGWRLTRYTESGYFDNHKKIKDFSSAELERLLYDKGSKPVNATDQFPKTGLYTGVINRIQKTVIEKGAKQYQKDIDRVTTTVVCSECQGTRVNALVRSATINDLSIADCVNMPIQDLLAFLDTITNKQVETILIDLKNRLRTMISVGLDYLTLGRTTSTLSGGESQRLKMTKHLNSSLADVLYIFDEPSVGLHPEDIIGINKIFSRLKEKGNTVVLVDHDPDIIKLADFIIDLGPGAGSKGGQITYQGSYTDFLTSDTLTAKSLNEPHQLNLQEKEYSAFYTLENVSAFNIKKQSVRLPKGALTVVSGLAGSGKSTLIRKLFMEKYPEAIAFDQTPIRGSNRSNLLTYLGMFDVIRQEYAKISGKPASLFTFNGAGACPECKGKGYINYDLAYMGDVRQECEKCHGKRYNEEALSYSWKGFRINELFQLTVAEAHQLLALPEIRNTLKVLIEANLAYLTLGQSLDTLSGGERQRLKIATMLLHRDSLDSAIFILDEPSTGLHESDIKSLLKLLDKLKENGKTLIVLEHNLSMISQADWIIDMGPRGGMNGGEILFQGYLPELLECKKSYTAKHLKRFIEN